MRIVIVGGSKFGVATAERLIELNHEVVLIDRDRERLERLAERLDCGMIEGDGTLPTTLREAFSSEKDNLIALTNASDDNILASLVARSIGYGRVVPQIVSPELLDVCHELQLDDVITPHATVAESICHGLEERAEIVEETSLQAELRLRRMTLPDRTEDTILADLPLPEDVRAVARIREGHEKLASAETALTAGDCLLLAGPPVTLDTLADSIFAP
ncbi:MULTISPECIES: potassium channel family protein [unclassified Dinoroseobacter]|uniref:potassium channel family protein n=1 Tax=unclassified Dinoroseobacter TaxID=2620028 RepID=UPI003C7B1887